MFIYILLNNNKLIKNFVESIASQWRRYNIETVEEAMRVTEKEHKKLHKMVQNTSVEKKTDKVKKTEENLPAWFHQEQSVIETTKEDEEEMDSILKELI